jgi:DNA-binding LacI/PurR family transcriptional regulator
MTVQLTTRRVTSVDVARAAGVSRTTVSYVLNNTAHQKIPEDTRLRVLEAATRLGYAPSAAARALRIGRTDTVLFLLPDWPISPAIGSLVEHLAAAVAAHGLMLVVHPHASAGESLAEVWKATTPAAVVGFQEFTRDEAAAMRAAGIDVVLSLWGSSGRGRDFGVRGQRIGQLQAEHLATIGHTRLGYALPEDERVQQIARSRLEGVQQACAERGLLEPLVLTVPLDPGPASTAVRTWRSADPRVTGVCCFNDNVALAVLAGLRELGLRAPGHLAVVGVDDIAAARLADPPLTTVTTDMQALAGRVAETIMASLNDAPRSRRAAPELVHLIQRRSV